MINAIQAANAAPNPDIICLANNSIYPLTQVIDNTTGLPSITSPITIWGNNATITRVAGSPTFRIFRVALNGSLSIRDLTISNGSALQGGGIAATGALTLNNVIVRDQVASNAGGGLFISGSTAELTHVQILNNRAPVGAGVYVTGTATVVYLSRSLIKDNVANNLGGGLFNNNSFVTITTTVFVNNSAQQGGGIRNATFGTISITESLFQQNTAVDLGGAISTESENIEGSQSCFVDNMASRGRAVHNNTLLGITFENNWWGQTSGASTDDLLGLIDVDPFLTSPPVDCELSLNKSKHDFRK
ncbi:MAG: hypothetical protein MUF87_11425 [Anaerolineae bacterium]|nr:hypothetical protein [Anaerolineae bacterium]